MISPNVQDSVTGQLPPEQLGFEGETHKGTALPLRNLTGYLSPRTAACVAIAKRRDKAEDRLDWIRAHLPLGMAGNPAYVRAVERSAALCEWVREQLVDMSTGCDPDELRWFLTTWTARDLERDARDVMVSRKTVENSHRRMSVLWQPVDNEPGAGTVRAGIREALKETPAFGIGFHETGKGPTRFRGNAHAHSVHAMREHQVDTWHAEIRRRYARSTGFLRIDYLGQGNTALQSAAVGYAAKYVAKGTGAAVEVSEQFWMKERRESMPSWY